MNCKNPGCGNKDRIRPIEGQGSFQGFDVFQCPSCKQVAHTIKRDPAMDRQLAGIKKAKNIKKGKDLFPTAEAPDYGKLLARAKQLKTPIKGLSTLGHTGGAKRPYRNTKGQPYTAADMNKSIPERIKSFIGRQPPALPQPTAPDSGKWNSTKYCGKKGCGFSQNVVGGSPKDINLVHCPRCKTKMQNKPFSPNF